MISPTDTTPNAMTPNASRQGCDLSAISRMLRRGFASIALLLAAAGHGQAADSASRDIIGFSPEGRYFAFEQYGIQDGSGFPYSDVFILETSEDKWVRGTPARELLRSDLQTVETARVRARKRIDPYLLRLRIGAANGKLLVSDRATNAEDAARFVPFTYAGEGSAQGLGTVRLRLNEIVMPMESCAALGTENRGFALVLEDPSGLPLRILEEDTAIPPSRGCPVHYGISDVLVFPRPGAGPVLVVLVSVYSFGFEGLDRRFIAISSVFDEAPAPTR